MKDLYHLLTVTDVHQDNAAILNVLTGIKEGRLPNDLWLVNYFREMPVSYGAELKYVEDDLVGLHVHQHQAVVMSMEKETCIKSAHLPHDVVAKVYKVNIDKSLAFLNRFSYCQIRAERRRFVRVQINDCIGVTFRRLETSIFGSLYDISISGLSLVMDSRLAVEAGTEGVLVVNLPSGQLELSGRLIKAVPHDEQWKYIFEMEADHRAEAAISQFIFQKQVEIIRLLKDQFG